MNPNQRFSILTFPQFFDGNELTINIVVLPRNQNPLTPAIEQHPSIPNAPAFADAALSFTANIFNGLSTFPHNFAPISGLPLPTNAPNDTRGIFEALGNHFSITNLNVLNTNANVNNPFNDKPEAARPESRTVKKYLPKSYRKAFNFTSPKHPNALTNDAYQCAMRDATKQPGFQRSPETISWGKAIAYLMRQPAMARQGGMIYQTSMVIDPTHFENGGWLYIDLDIESDYRAQQENDPTFIKRYAARIPALEAGVPRQVFAPVQFPVLQKTTEADPDPAPNGNYDKIFIEAEEFSDGFAKIVHCQQPPNRDLLVEENDGAHPVKDIGIRLGWNDEQILIWYIRQLEANPSGNLSGRIDAPLGVFGYNIDVRETAEPENSWDSMNQVSSIQPLTLSRGPGNFNDPIQLGPFEGELPYQVYPMQLDGRKNLTYWLPMYFANWNGHNMVLPDPDAAQIYQTTNINVLADPEDQINDTGTGISGPAQNQLNQIYNPGLNNTPLRYGNNYEFRIRMQDLSGGTPAPHLNPINETASDITSCRFKRHISPNQPRIQELVPFGVNTDSIANNDAATEITVLNIQRPKLGYPAVVYTGKYADPIQRLIDQSNIGITVDQGNHAVNAEHRVGLGIADPDVDRLEIIVELETLKMDKLESVSGKENYVHFYTTYRSFAEIVTPDDYESILSLAIQYKDAKVIHIGDEVDVTNDLDLPADIDSLPELVLPTGRKARLTIRAVCEEKIDEDTNNFDDEYYGFIEPKNKAHDNRFGEPFQVMAYKESEDETGLLIQTPGVPMIQGVFMQPDLVSAFDGKATSLLFGKPNVTQLNNVQQLADVLNIESNKLTLNAPKGERVVFGCSSRIRHTLAPDHSSLTFASKGDLVNHWLVCISVEVDRDWMWDALKTRSFILRRTKKYTNDATAESTDALIGDLEMINTASFESLHNPQRQSTRLVFIDAVEPKKDRLGNSAPVFPDTIDLTYSIEAQFKDNHGLQSDENESLELNLPITTPPSQVPKIASAGIALSPYVRNETYSASEARKRYLWIEFEEEVEDENDIYFARVLAVAPDQLISNNNADLLVGPEEPAIPLDPEWIRIVTENATNDLAGLNAMQPMKKSTVSNLHYILPLPPGLHADSDEMFGFFTYEFRVGHYRNPASQEMVWTTAQGRFGRPLRSPGIQHPAPTLTCMPNRDEKKLWVTAPYAVAVHDGKNVSATPPRTELWALLYAQVKMADNLDYRNILLDDRALDWRIQVEREPDGLVFEKYPEDQLQVLQSIAFKQFKYEANVANAIKNIKLIDFSKKNKDATKYGTTVWSNAEVMQLLSIMGLPTNSHLSVVVVETLPQITNVFEHVSNLGKQKNAQATRAMVPPNKEQQYDTMVKNVESLEQERLFVNRKSPLDEELGNHRILRTSPLTAVPEVCCEDC